MNHNRYNISIIVFILALLMQGCRGDFCNSGYDFQIDLSISPNSFELQKGDTLNISMVTDNTSLVDSTGDRVVEFPNFDPNVYFLLPRLDSTVHLDGFLFNEMILNPSYETTLDAIADHSSVGLFFLEIDTTTLSSKLDFQVVLQQEGTYGLQLNPGIFKNWRNIDFPNKCDYRGKGSIDATFLIDGDRHKHLDLLTDQELTNLDFHWNERDGSRRKSSSFYFRVVE